MKTIALLLLLSVTALAQPAVTRGNILKRPEYQTYGTISLFVDGTLGSNSNPCTASGASACLTLAGAFSKLPRFIRNNVTITVAAGTYAEALNLANGLVIDNGVSVTVTGALGLFTPATGSNSGSTTASAAASSSGTASITDSTQTWTVNDLKGRFVNFTSGALSGQQFPITSNTATTLSMAGSTAAGTGVTYTIVTPSVIFAQPSGGTIANVDGRGALIFTSVEVTATGTSGLIFRGPSGLLTFNTSRLVMAASIAALNVQLGTLTLARSVVQTTAAGAGLLLTGGSGTPLPGGIVSNSYFRATSGIALHATANSWMASMTSVVFEVTTGTGFVTRAPLILSVAAGFYATCTTAASGVGAAFGTIATLGGYNSASISLPSAAQVVGCGTGLMVYGPSAIQVNAMNFNTVTTAVLAARGGAVEFSGVPTFSTVTNELSLDGTAYTYAFLNGLSPSVISNSYGSVINK